MKYVDLSCLCTCFLALRYPAETDSAHDGFRTTGSLHFIEDMSKMSLHGAIADVELNPYSFVRIPFGCKSKHIQLTVCGWFHRFVIFSLTQIRHELLGDRCVKFRFAFMHIAHRLNQILHSGCLKYIS